MDNKNKANIDALWAKYQKTLEMLNDALEKLEQKPKEVEKIVEVERVVEVPVTEWVEVPVDKIVEKVINLSDEERKQYEDRIEELENKVESLLHKKPKDYWGKPKNPSKKTIDDMTYEQQTEQRYFRLVHEVRQGKLDINSLSHAERTIIEKLLNE